MDRDYPVGHPAASDYKGEPYVDKFASYHFDFPEDSPARGGKNRGELDTPDGVRESRLRQVTPLQDLAKQGALPVLRDPDKAEPLPVPPDQLAHIYATRLAATFNGEPTEAEKQSVGFIKNLGYTTEQAIKLFMSYLKPADTAEQAKG